jgi:xanthine/CO dehydrogenase XdhC/CoxF family maturation factor
VVGPLPSGQRWYLQVSFHGVDRASLYHQDSTGQWVGQHAGDHVSVAQWPLRDRLPAFAMQQGNGAHEYWLRIDQQAHPGGRAAAPDARWTRLGRLAQHQLPAAGRVLSAWRCW